MPSSRSRIGRSAEILAAAELGRMGYRIVASNYRTKHGEIDFVAEDGGWLVFVEVRCKRTGQYGSPAESVTPAKQKRLFASAEMYVEEHGIRDRNCRFDVVEVCSAEGKLVVRDVLRDAFSL